jgi:hypothetical protein
MNHNTENNRDLLRILAECAAECNRCFDACLENDRTDDLVRAIRLCRDCARICSTTATFVASNSEHAQHLVRECAEICRSCSKTCNKHTEEEHECKPCARICRECEEACNSFAGVSA